MNGSLTVMEIDFESRRQNNLGISWVQTREAKTNRANSKVVGVCHLYYPKAGTETPISNKNYVSMNDSHDGGNN